MQEVFEIDIRNLHPYKENEAIYNKRQDIDELAVSIIENGILTPLTINQDNIIISGNSRYKACMLIDKWIVPVKRVETFNEDHLRTLVVESNRQRVKTAQEVIRELYQEEEIKEVQRKCDYSNNLSFDGNLLRTEKKEKSSIPD